MDSSERKANRWCILRMAGPSTMRVVASLQDAGLCVWTPTEHVKRRLPRGKVTEHLIVPMAPTYAFAREAELPELRRITRLDVSPHPRFSILQPHHAMIFVPHVELHRMRAQQQFSYLASLPGARKRGKPRGAAFELAEAVTFTSGPLTGLRCIVDRSDGRTTEVTLNLFGRASRMTIETLQLRSLNVPETKQAA